MIGHMGHLLWDERTMDTFPWAIAKWSLEELKKGGLKSDSVRGEGIVH